ncbi:MAG: DegV family protein [Anaerolineae bacterium]|nr:DegV family protein [Anaerolineae bacterium]
MSTRFAVITDTTADLAPELAAERGVYLIPQVIIWGREVLKDGVSITSPEFYRRLATADEMPTTSRPAPADVAELFQRARDENDADALVVVTVSDEVSGTYPSAMEARKEVDFPVHVFDTRTISLALGLTALRVADARDAGASADEALALAKQVAAGSHAIFSPGTLEFLRRGGRIGGASHLIGTALSIKPLLILQDGKVQPLENVRTRKRAIKRLVELVAQYKDPARPLHVGVVHGDAAAEADALAEMIQAESRPDLLLKGWVSPSIGVHVGPGVLGVMVVQ